MGISNKTMVISAIVIVAVIAVLAFATPAHAQFRPCVWPNTCG